jgi:hypothetical protein
MKRDQHHANDEAYLLERDTNYLAARLNVARWQDAENRK